MKKNLFLAALAIVALASCTDSEFVGDNSPTNPNTGPGAEKAIVFNSGANAITRASWTGKDAATLLNNNFVFAGTKSNGSLGTNYVFDQYNANWKENTANTTESNSNNWEYVGYDLATTSSLPSGTKQTIKYWDYSQSQYDFAAYSLGTGSATATAITFNSLGTSAYTLTGTVEDLEKCYISDLVTAYKKTANGNTADDYGKVVNFSFRSLAAKIRLAFYETVPGYSVKDVQFYSVATDGTASSTPTLFTSTAVLPNASGTMTITFPNTGWDKSPNGPTASQSTDYNKAHVTFAQASETSASKTLSFDALANFASAEINETFTDDPAVGWIGRASNTATFAGGLENGEGKYKTILPLEAGTPLQLRIKYKLVSTDGSNEIISVDNATAVIPAEFAMWNPNYAYTYIFKISDLTNGSTGFGPDGSTPVCGLTPITLNAVVVDSEDGVQETITTVNSPSITTYMLGKVITENDEYIVNGSHPIFIVVNNGTSNVVLNTNGNGSTTWTNAKLYTAVVADNALQGITEESVDNALRYGVIGTDASSKTTYTVTDAATKNLVLTDITTSLTGEQTTIPATDSPTGNEITSINNAKFVPESGKTYVFQYIANPSMIVSPTYEVVPYVTKLTYGTRYYKSTADATGFEATGKEVVCKVLYTKSADVYTRFTGTSLASGTKYYLSKNDTEGFTADGTETLMGDDVIDDMYYTKSSTVYTPVGYLKAGETYYTSNRGAGKFVAVGSEIITTNTYWTCTNAASVVEGQYKYKVIKVQ